MTLSKNVYNFIKWLVIYGLPGFSTLYFTLSSIWGLPHTEQIIGTISSLSISLGIMVGISKASYVKSGLDMDGIIQIDKSGDKDLYRLMLNNDVTDLDGKSRVCFKVDPNAKLNE